MLTYEQFKSEILQHLKGVTPPNLELRFGEVMKNNDVVLDSISFCNPNASQQVTPVLYLEPFYDKYENGDKSIDEICESIKKLLTSDIGVPEFDTQCIATFDEAKPYITFSLVNMEMNTKRLLGLVHRPWYDLAITYKYSIHPWSDGCGSIAITQMLLAKWNVTEEDLYEAALENAKKEKWQMLPIAEVLENMMSDSGKDMDFELPDINLYVIYNDIRIGGAYALLVPDVFKQLMDNFSISSNGLYILPSSCHELLVLPADNQNVEYLYHMVKEVNDSICEKGDVLSYSVYFYDPNSSSINIAELKEVD